MDSPKYIDFDVSEIPYKVVNDHEIKCNVLTPKNTYLGKHPVLVKFHGGFLVIPLRTTVSNHTANPI